MSVFTTDLSNSYISTLHPNIQAKVPSFGLHTLSLVKGSVELRDHNTLSMCVCSSSADATVCLEVPSSCELFCFDNYFKTPVLAKKLEGVSRFDFVLSPATGTEYIVLLELSNSARKYVVPPPPDGSQDKAQPEEYKLVKAEKQFESAINWCQKKGISFEKYGVKRAIFAWRDSQPEVRNSVMIETMAFIAAAPSSVVHSIAGGLFKFQMVEYPEIVQLS